MIEAQDLAHVNAALNGVSAVLLAFGYRAIKGKDRDAHRRFMIGAVSVSLLFLVSYVIYHMNVGAVPFTETGVVRTIYFVILITHVVLAAVVPPLVMVTVYRAWRGQFERHRALAKWTWPIWMYVSVTGVMVYLMLYHLFPSSSL